MIEEIKTIEDLIRRKTELLEDIPTNIKEKKVSIVKNLLNIELDILYSKIKYDGKIRLFIFEIYRINLCIDFIHDKNEEKTIFDTNLIPAVIAKHMFTF
jgi:hypothetical protein